MVLALIFTTAASAADITCAVTLPNDWPGPNQQGILGGESRTYAWYGSRNLAALIPVDGQWSGTGPENGYANKFWWYREGFDARIEPKPDLIISGLRLDDVAEPVQVNNATSGFGNGWHAMLVGIQFPSPGCWELRGSYNGSEELSVVLKVGAPAKN